MPLDPAGRKVGMYCCGPTVYDYGHIGNFRTFTFGDLVRRYLEFRGYQVTHVMNITDVEDKIIRRVAETGRTLEEYTRSYENAFLDDSRLLNLLPPHVRPRATEHVREIVDLIAQLVDRGIAYKTADGSVYFSIQKYEEAGRKYGQLLNLNFDGMRTVDRVRNDEYAKESVADFALWKARVPEDGGVFWPSPWGEGRPGWHIECSAMGIKHLGASFDLHLGGEDLIFPHHEDEIAQSEGACCHKPGERFVKYWVHASHLKVEGEKMSKSLGNFFTLRDLLAKGYQGREVRYLLLGAHYRDTFNFTLEGLSGARSALARIDDCLRRLRETAAGAAAEPDPLLVEKFTASMDEDLNISAAWGAVFDWVRDCNRKLADGSMTREAAASAVAAWQRLDTVLGLDSTSAAEEAPAEIVALMDGRQAARKARDFAMADQIRNELKSKGWVVEDTPKGPRLKRIG